LILAKYLPGFKATYSFKTKLNDNEQTIFIKAKNMKVAS